MWQWILTGLIVCSALVYAAIKIVRTLKRTSGKATDCDGCSSDCADCPLNPTVNSNNMLL